MNYIKFIFSDKVSYINVDQVKEINIYDEDSGDFPYKISFSYVEGSHRTIGYRKEADRDKVLQLVEPHLNLIRTEEDTPDVTAPEYDPMDALRN